MKIYLDDQRDAPDGWTLARSVIQFIGLINENQNDITALSFDYDMGPGMSGAEALELVIKNYPELFHSEITIEVHSARDEVKEKMESRIKFCREHLNELIQEKNKPSSSKELNMK